MSRANIFVYGLFANHVFEIHVILCYEVGCDTINLLAFKIASLRFLKKDNWNCISTGVFQKIVFKAVVSSNTADISLKLPTRFKMSDVLTINTVTDDLKVLLTAVCVAVIIFSITFACDLFMYLTSALEVLCIMKMSICVFKRTDDCQSTRRKKPEDSHLRIGDLLYLFIYLFIICGRYLSVLLSLIYFAFRSPRPDTVISRLM
jgi:hypothetical protein